MNHFKLLKYIDKFYEFQHQARELFKFHRITHLNKKPKISNRIKYHKLHTVNIF